MSAGFTRLMKGSQGGGYQGNNIDRGILLKKFLMGYFAHCTPLIIKADMKIVYLILQLLLPLSGSVTC